MAVGGDLIEISYNHPTLGSGTWFPKSNEDSTFDPGGYRGVDDVNMVDGGGNNIKQLNLQRWSLETTVSWNANIANELEQARLLASDPVDAEWNVTHKNGTVWKGTGSPVGDIQGNGNQATMSVKLAGGGIMRKIAG